jgi:hypothetical protein
VIALFAHHECLIVVALVSISAGIAFPIWERLGFGWWSSAALSVLSGLVVVGCLMLRAIVCDALDRRRRARKPPDATG